MSTEQPDTVRYERGDDGVVVLTMDDPTQSANTMNEAWVVSMRAAVERLHAERDDVRGVVVASAKARTFFAGGDLRRLVQARPEQAAELFEEVQGIKAVLRRLETLGRPVVAAINGAALGGGLEIALACHHRIAADGSYEIGLPEVTLGLLPGAGGVTRTVRMLGLQTALTDVLLQGPRMKPRRALEQGLVDEVVDPEELMTAARAWIDAHGDDPEACTQPWDREGYRIPGGTPATPKLAQVLPAFPPTLRKQTKGAPYPAPRAIMEAAVEGAQVDLDTALRIESRYLVSLLTGQTFKNMTQAFFFDLQAVNGGTSRPADVPRREVQRLLVLGAGMMGAGVAYVAARAGIEVVLKDVSLEAAEKGRAHAEKLLAKQVERGRTSPEQRDAILARIHPTADYADAAGADAVVEAVFESVELKHQVFADLEPVVADDALLGSNTSSLPITLLAGGVERAEDFIGIHFFSPVEKMQLVEIIVGEKTSDEAIARAVDLARQIRKIPIVVNDSRGFFTSRVFGTLVMEGAQMVADGVDPVLVERAATTAGFPAPPLAMIDEVTLTLPQKIEDAARDAAVAEGLEAPPRSGAMRVVDALVERGRTGKAAGAGFYDYPTDGPKRLWAGLRELAGAAEVDVSLRDVQERLLAVMAVETVRCLEEGVLRSVPEANIGSIFGIGFPPLHGGALQYVDGYQAADGSIGVAAFLARAEELAAAYGERFSPPALLREKAAAGETFGTQGA